MGRRGDARPFFSKGGVAATFLSDVLARQRVRSACFSSQWWRPLKSDACIAKALASPIGGRRNARVAFEPLREMALISVSKVRSNLPDRHRGRRKQPLRLADAPHRYIGHGRQSQRFAKEPDELRRACIGHARKLVEREFPCEIFVDPFDRFPDAAVAILLARRDPGAVGQQRKQRNGAS